MLPSLVKKRTTEKKIASEEAKKKKLTNRRDIVLVLRTLDSVLLTEHTSDKQTGFTHHGAGFRSLRT